MGVSGDKKTVVVDDQELDIYASMELRDVLLEALENGVDEIKLDLSKVSSLSTPAAQVILSALRSFKKMEIVGGIETIINEDLRSMGVELCRQ